jgi:hypothetical protein
MRPARLRSSFRNRIGKQGGAPSRRQGRGAHERDDQMDDVQPEKIAGRRRHLGWSDFGVAPSAGGIGAGVGRSRAIRMTGLTIQGGVREMATAKHGQNCSNRGRGLQVPLLAERGGFMGPKSQGPPRSKIC